MKINLRGHQALLVGYDAFSHHMHHEIEFLFRILVLKGIPIAILIKVGRKKKMPILQISTGAKKFLMKQVGFCRVTQIWCLT